MSEPQFIGRRSDLESVLQHIYHCLSGQPRILLIEGLAGVGKTRFLEQIGHIAIELGMDVATGCSDEMAAQPYSAFSGLLPQLEASEVLHRHEVSLLHQLFGLSVPATSSFAFDVQAEGHVQTLMSVSGGLLRLADEQPLLLITENLHAADQASLDVFTHLAFTLAEHTHAPVLLIASYRPVAHDTATGQLLDRWRSEPIVHTLALSAFTEPETREFLQQLSVERPTQQLVQAIHTATRGIPLFIQEAVYHAQGAGTLIMQGGYLTISSTEISNLELPPDISGTISARIDNLSDHCKAILASASLLGDKFSLEKLLIVEEDGIDATLAALAEASSQGILHHKEGIYHFTHSLIRQACTSRLSLSQRQRLHLNIALALERHHANDQKLHALEMATHLLEAGSLADTETLFIYAQEAGNQAFARFAWSDAARYFEAAANASDVTSIRASLHLQAGISHYRNQDAGPALEHFTQARTHCRGVGDPASLARTLMWLVRIHLTHLSVPMGVLPPYTEELEAALSALGDEQLTLQGHIMTVLSQVYRHARQPQKGVQLAQTALAIGRDMQDNRLSAQAGESLGLAHMSNLQVDAAIASWQDARRFAQEADDLRLQSFPWMNLPLALNLQGALEEAESMARGGVELAQRLHEWLERSKALSHLASIAAASGHFRAVEQYAQDTMAMVQRSYYPWGGFRALSALAGASAAQGLWEQAHEALHTISEPGRMFVSSGDIVQVFVRVFRQVVLGYETKYLTEKVIPLCDELMQVATTDTYSLAPLCAMIELGDLTFMPEIVERPATLLKEAWERGVVFTSGWSFLIPRSLGLAATMLEAWEEATEYFEQALAIATYANALPELGRTYLDYANLVVHSPEIEDLSPVADYLRQARRILHERGMLPHARHAAEYLDKLFPDPHREDIDPSGNGAHPPRSDDEPPGDQ